MGKMKEARDYLSLGKNILRDLFGENSPDYQYFDRYIWWIDFKYDNI